MNDYHDRDWVERTLNFHLSMEVDARSTQMTVEQLNEGTVCLGSTNKLCLGQTLMHVNPLEMT